MCIRDTTRIVSYTTDSNGRSEATLTVPITVTTGTELDVHRLKGPHEIQFTGIVSSTHQVMVSYDGTNFEQITAVDDNSVVKVSLSPKKIRVDTSAFSSGAPVATYVNVAGAT